MASLSIGLGAAKQGGLVFGLLCAFLEAGA